MSIAIEPNADIPIPYDAKDEKEWDFLESVEVTANTNTLLESVRIAAPEYSVDDAKYACAQLNRAMAEQNADALNQPVIATAAKAFIDAYSTRLAMDASDIRTSLTNKLLELANCGDPKYELKAIELLGKHSDISLFTERSQVTVTYQESSKLEQAIREKIKRLMNGRVVDVTPMSSSYLTEELGVIEKDGESDD